MDIIIQKFGGSSVANTDKLFKVCEHIISAHKNGYKVVVVVSAQGKTTDRLISEEKEIMNCISLREHDVLVSTGEQITIAKLCMCLESLGHKAISLTGWQIPIITDSIYGNARIKNINNTKILDKLKEDYIVVIAGFQGVNENGDITTMGRGGSDTTAVALAASLNAKKCEIYTDVDGVYSSDPNSVENVKKIECMSYDEMLEMASLGSKVLHNRCVEIAKNYHIPLVVKSTFQKDSKGTLITDERNLEDLFITGVSKDDNCCKITISNSDINIYDIFKLLSDNNINTDTIVLPPFEHKIKDLTFSINKVHLEKTLKLLKNRYTNITIKTDVNLCKISVVGVGIANKPIVITNILEALSEEKIAINMISTSEIKISILIDIINADKAINSIHRKFIK